MSRDFRYERQIKKIHSSECLTKMNSIYGNDYNDIIVMAIDGVGDFVPALISVLPYYEDGGNLFFDMLDRQVKCTIKEMDFFCYFFKIGYTYIEYKALRELAELYCDGTVDYKKCRNIARGDDGQAKICLSTLIPLINSEKEMHILVIGSGSEDIVGSNFRSGRSYEALLDFLPRLGYFGSITLYDKYEFERRFRKDTFDVVMRSEYYNYDLKYFAPGGQEFTHIFDDVFIPTIVNEVVDIKYNNVVIDIKRGCDSKFAYAVRDGKLVICNRLVNHIDMSGAVGGGYMKVDNSRGANGKIDVKVYGSSNRVGHYSSQVLIDTMSDKYNLTFDDSLKKGRLTFDPESKIFKMYPKAVISCKFFGEKLPVRGKIFDQVWYDGKEKRFVYNCPVPVFFRSWKGCGCERCEQYQLIINCLVDYSGVGIKVILNLLNSVIHDKCLRSHGSMVLKIKNYIMSASHSRNKMQLVDDYICKRFGCSKDTVYRVVTLMDRINDISFCNKDMEVIKHHSNFVNYYGESRFYAKDGKTYYVLKDDSMVKFNSNGKLCLDVIPNYRPIDCGELLGETYSELLFPFRDDLSGVVGFNFSYFRGSEMCGFNRKYVYYISKEKEGDVVLDNLNGWYLKKVLEKN